MYRLSLEMVFLVFSISGLVGARPLADDAITQRRLTAIVTALIQCSVFITAPALLCLLHTCIQKVCIPKKLMATYYSRRLKNKEQKRLFLLPGHVWCYFNESEEHSRMSLCVCVRVCVCRHLNLLPLQLSRPQKKNLAHLQMLKSKMVKCVFFCWNTCTDVTFNSLRNINFKWMDGGDNVAWLTSKHIWIMLCGQFMCNKSETALNEIT